MEIAIVKLYGRDQMVKLNQESPIKGMKVKPYGLPLMIDAWGSFLSWASSKEEIKQQFKEETGHNLDSLVNVSTLDKMIDKATGRDRTVFIAWCDWVTENLWGTDNILENDNER